MSSSLRSQQPTPLVRFDGGNSNLIFEYVHNNIATLPQYGSLKGPLGTLIDGCGTCFDQAELMMVLLAKSEYEPKLVMGTITLTIAQLTAWLGCDAAQGSVDTLLGTGGFAANLALDATGNVVSATIDWAWVKVAVPAGGTLYVFDPATKPYVRKPRRPDLGTLLEYNQTTFLADALVGATITATSIQNVNRGNVRESINGFTSALVAELEGDLQGAGPDDILGGVSIVPLPFNTRRRNTSLSYGTEQSEHLVVPANRRTTVTITVQGTTAVVFNSSDIYGRRLSLFFTDAVAAVLSLDGIVQRTGPAGAAGPRRIDFAIDHPYPPDPDIPTADQTGFQTVEAYAGGAFVIGTGFGPVGRGMIERHRRILQQNAAVNQAGPSAEPVLGESLAMLSYTWLAQIGRALRIVDQLGDTSTVYHHGVGIVGMSAPKGTDKISGPFLDLAFNVFGTVQRAARPVMVGMTAAEKSAFRTILQLSSVLESGAIQQRQPGMQAVSTVKLIDFANTTNEVIFDIQNVTDYNAVASQLLAGGWNGLFLLSSVFQPVTQGSRVIIPRNAAMQINRWKGSGYFVFSATEDSISAVIRGGLNGGASTDDVPEDEVNDRAADQLQPPTMSFEITVPGFAGGDSYGQTGTVGDPVNAVTGSYVYSQDDLTVGSGTFPYALGVQRSYDSARTGRGDTMGAGWKHNFDLTVIRDSDGFEGMAATSPISGAPSIAAIYVLLDILNAGNLKPTLANCVVASLVAEYWMDLLTDNVVRLTRPGLVEHFVSVPDAQGVAVYKPPIGSVSRLGQVPNGTFALRTAEGLLLRFGAATATTPGNIISWENAVGVVVTFAYTSGRLSAVTTNLGRALTFGYDGNGRLTSVSDGEGRSVGYQYTIDAAGVARLTRFVDTMNKHTNFTYHADGALWQIFYPARPAVAFITLIYDELGRVKTQTDARGNLTEVYVAGRRTEIVPPLYGGAVRRNRQVWYFDPLGRTVAEIQDFGRGPAAQLLLNLITTHAYDGQSRRVRTTLPDGNSTETVYDKWSNPLTIRRVAKPGSGQASLEHRYEYISAAGREIFRRVSKATDPKGFETRYLYNAQGLVSQITQPAVSRPGVPTPVQPVRTFAYVTSGAARGLIAQDTDEEGRVTSYEYDADGNFSARIVDAGTGRLNLRTTYAHDGVGNLIETVSPRGNVSGANSAAFRMVYTYDPKRRRTAEEQPALDVRTFTTYDADDRVTEVRRLLTPASGSAPAVYQTATTTYTNSGKPSVETDAAGKTVTYGYDAADKLRTVTLGSGRRATYNYDVVGRLAAVVDGVFGTLDPSITVNRGAVTRETRTYTKNSLLATFKDGRNNETGYAYDGFDRLSTVTHADSSTETMSYDANDNVLTRKTRAGEVITSTYDALNRLETRNVPGNANAGPVAYSYAYDLVGRMLFAGQNGDPAPMAFGYDTAGRLAVEQHADGKVVGYFHDEDGNRQGVSWPETGAQAYVAGYDHDALGRVVQVLENADGVRLLAGYAYDRLSRRTNIVRLNGAATIYGYFANDLVEVVRHQFTASSAVDFLYQYNSENALVARGTSEAAYRPSATNPGLVPGSAGYVANALNQYTSVGAAALSYDGNGNLSGDGVWSYGYDPQNRLVSATAANPTRNVTYGYDALGRRRSRTSGAATTRFLWAGEQEIAEYNTAGALVRRHVPGPGLDEPVAAVTPSPSITRRFNHADALGSVVAVSVAAGAVSERFAYTVYGVADANTGSAMRYTGRRLDATTGLYDLRARDYSPMLGRFLQADPIGIAGGINLYTYVGNDPLNSTDPMGLFTIQVGISVYVSVLSVSFQFSVGVATDGRGNTGFYGSGSAGPSIGTGLRAGIGGAISNAPEISDLAGQGSNVSLVAGARGVAGSIDIGRFASGGREYSSAGGVVGIGQGVSVSAGPTYTYVWPQLVFPLIPNHNPLGNRPENNLTRMPMGRK